MSEFLVVLVTTPDSATSEKIAEALVSERLAACVNIVPSIQSIYRWEGEINRDPESLMIVKTTRDRYEALENRVRQLHGYSTPEVIAIEIESGSSDYLRWLADSVSTKNDARGE